jgi:hypothetical protein
VEREVGGDQFPVLPLGVGGGVMGDNRQRLE